MPPPRRKRRIAILGGGAAGMAAAWRLSDPALADDIESVTVYQRGWRLGGKGASSRGVNGRIEEHGLHVWLGYYENAFRLMREVYGELDRPTTAPEAPIRTWTDAFKPASTVGLQEYFGDEWRQWIAVFAENDQLPGEPDADAAPMTVAEFVRRALKLLGDFYGSLEREPGKATLTASPRIGSSRDGLVGRAVQTAMAAAAQLSSIGRAEAALLAEDRPSIAPLEAALAQVNDVLEEAAGRDRSIGRLRALGDLIVTTVRGILADGLLTDPRGFAAVNDEEYRDWMRRHGAAEATLDSPLVRGVYDLAFGYEDGDPDRGRFAAGTGIVLSGKFFFDYKGAIFWKMQAGMGDVMFAPLYEALRDRGVRFEFFHRLDNLGLSVEGDAVDTIELSRQVQLRDPGSDYQPLVVVGGLPVFPDEPIADQLTLEGLHGPWRRELESVWAQQAPHSTVTLRRGDDFDDAVFAIPVGMARHVAGELIARHPAWADMVREIKTVATQAFQVWLTVPEADLGWDTPGVTITGYVKPFDTWASMTQLIAAERWTSDQPKSLGYFCNTLATAPEPDRSSPDYWDAMQAVVRQNAVDFLRTEVASMWPGTIDPSSGEFDWELLAGGEAKTGEARFDTQFWTANVDPSERYVQSVPGSDRYRLRADQSGCDNLFLAGDWIDSGLNAGCVEAAVISGLQAANAVLGRPLTDGLAGFYATMAHHAE